MKLNTISCGGYSIKNNRAKFSLYDTTVQEVASLNESDLTLYDESDEIVEVIKGYEIANISVENDSITLTMLRKLSEASASAIQALEENYNNSTLKIKSLNQTVLNFGMAFSPIIMRAGLSDKEASTVASLYTEWTVGFDYKRNWIIRYDDNLYRIGQDHTSQEQWVPGTAGTEALYSKIEITEGGYEVWQEWDGVSGSYANGQIVKDPTDEQLYQSLIDNNVWGPPSTQPTYWQLYTES